jgi:hypothetical protein
VSQYQLLPEVAERHNIFGTSRSGKSTHLDMEMRARQSERPEAWQLLLDTKPRFRAETERGITPGSRRNASWRYRAWSAGPVLPGSVLVNIWDDHPFRGLWKRPGEIAIMQSGDHKDWLRMLELSMGFVRAQVGDTERHLTADEVLDFYGRTTHSIKNAADVFYLASRSGGERMIGETLGAQRIHGIPIMIRNQATRQTLYQLEEEKDLGYLISNGIPHASVPRQRFVFNQWVKEPGGLFGPTFTGHLAVPQEYLDQLAKV